MTILFLFSSLGWEAMEVLALVPSSVMYNKATWLDITLAPPNPMNRGGQHYGLAPSLYCSWVSAACPRHIVVLVVVFLSWGLQWTAGLWGIISRPIIKALVSSGTCNLVPEECLLHTLFLMCFYL